MVKGIIVFYFFQRNELVVNEKQKVPLSYDLKKVKREGKFKGTKKLNAILPAKKVKTISLMRKNMTFISKKSSKFNENKFRTIADIRLNYEKAEEEIFIETETKKKNYKIIKADISEKKQSKSAEMPNKIHMEKNLENSNITKKINKKIIEWAKFENDKRKKEEEEEDDILEFENLKNQIKDKKLKINVCSEKKFDFNNSSRYDVLNKG